MIVHFEIFLRMVRRLFSRSEWVIRLLGLSRSPKTASPGLVLIQIDGLAFRQFERAIAQGNLPFLKRLLSNEHYAEHSVYSGMPSNTPAFQGELFYGVRGCVPAFSFLSKKSGRIFKMYESSSACEVEEALKSRTTEPLLAGGSSYANIFTGGAKEAHFCAAQMGWGGLFCANNPLALSFLPIFYADVFLRILVLLVVEFFLAVFDSVRGALAGENFLEELRYIPTRVAMCVLLRELTRIGVQLDIARGLEIIHVNFLGYDEQAHRRGPSSRFAHWSLRGIDYSIARIWQSAQRSSRRYYDVWIYSDHGQDKTRSYARAHGKSLKEAVSGVFGSLETLRDDRHGIQHKRAAYLGNVRLRVEKTGKSAGMFLAAMGPLGHVYAWETLTENEKERLAEKLVSQAHIPMVLTAAGSSEAWAWTAKGKFMLPAEGAAVLGQDHPFLDEVALDLAAVCHHPDAGDFVLCGWFEGAEPSTFPYENGSHAGASPNECNGFALFSVDAPLPPRQSEYLRPSDLRSAALKFLNRPAVGWPESSKKPALVSRRLRVITYNVHGCAGMDGRISPERIARVIARHDPDVVALQEVDLGRLRSGFIDQAEAIAKKLEMSFHFHPVFCFEDEKYGNAVLSRHPMHLIRMGALPQSPRRTDTEPRGALWVALDVNGVKVQFINCHLSLWPHERLLQAAALTSPEWLSNPLCEDPVILCGDFNAPPDSQVYRLIGRAMHDTQRASLIHRPRNTWLGRFPLSRIDHVFTGPGVNVLEVRVPATGLDKIASDHLPLVVDIQLSAETEDATSVPLREAKKRAWRFFRA